MQEKKNKTNKDRDSQKNEKKNFTIVTKRIKRAHTVISGDINRVESRRINYAKIISIYSCVQKKNKKAMFIRSSRDNRRGYLRSTMCAEKERTSRKIIYKS